MTTTDTDETFDGISCRFGLVLFPDPAAVNELRRVLGRHDAGAPHRA